MTSTRGSREEARKLAPSATSRPLTNAKRNWIEKAVKALIRRKGEYDADPGSPLMQIDMQDI